MKIMRSNYDKMHRCPDWSGPALKRGKGDCPGGSLSRQMSDDKHPRWKFYTCPECGTVVLPNILRNLDPSWWKSEIYDWYRFDFKNWLWKIRNR